MAEYYHTVDAFQWQPGMNHPMVKEEPAGCGTVQGANCSYHVSPGDWVIKDPLIRGYTVMPVGQFEKAYRPVDPAKVESSR